MTVDELKQKLDAIPGHWTITDGIASGYDPDLFRAVEMLDISTDEYLYYGLYAANLTKEME